QRGSYAAKGTIRWASAAPVMEALKPEFPENFADHYVITLSGFAWPPRDEERSEEKALDELEQVTFLKTERGRSAQPALVEKPISSAGSGNILFGFIKDSLRIEAEDRDVLFTTRLGRSPLEVKFTPKEMQYRGKLAL